MKIKKMAGALALTAALAMGTMPAFAASATDETGFDDASAGETHIKAKVTKDLNPAIKATVPLNVVVTFGSTGVSKILAPDASSYKITNTGSGAIKVTKAELDELNTDYFISTAMRCGAETDPNLGKVPGYSTIFNDPAANANHICLTLKAGNASNGVNTYLAGTQTDAMAAEVSPGLGSALIDGYQTATTGGITIAKDGDLPIQLGGVVNIKGTALSPDSTIDTLCKIKYTIAGA